MNPDFVTPTGSNPQAAQVPIMSNELKGIEITDDTRLGSRMAFDSPVTFCLSQLIPDDLFLAKRTGTAKDCAKANYLEGQGLMRTI